MSSADHLLVMRTDGTVEGVYDDAMIPVLSALGRPLIRRAGHVEEDGFTIGWQADLSPIGGPVLGPFASRRAALEAERDWLEAVLIGG